MVKNTSGDDAMKADNITTKNINAPKTGFNRSGIKMPFFFSLMT
jgi:hypothetical protein